MEKSPEHSKMISGGYLEREQKNMYGICIYIKKHWKCKSKKSLKVSRNRVTGHLLLYNFL